jgi:hypothetical protein
MPLGATAARCHIIQHVSGAPTIPQPAADVTPATTRGRFGSYDVTWSEWVDGEGPIIATTEHFSDGKLAPPTLMRDVAWCRAPAKQLASLRDLLERASVAKP